MSQFTGPETLPPSRGGRRPPGRGQQNTQGTPSPRGAQKPPAARQTCREAHARPHGASVLSPLRRARQDGLPLPGAVLGVLTSFHLVAPPAPRSIRGPFSPSPFQKTCYYSFFHFPLNKTLVFQDGSPSPFGHVPRQSNLLLRHLLVHPVDRHVIQPCVTHSQAPVPVCTST